MPVNSSNSDIFKMAFNLPPQEAINFLKNKAPEISYDWYDVYREAHVKAFTVAGLAKLDVLQDVQNALIEAQEKGQSLETFKQNFLSLLKKKGWYGEQTVKRPDGSVKKVNVSSPWRVKTIYRTNMATAAMAGMYKELKKMADIMPYWRYVTVGDGRVREEHAKIHGRILRHDDPFWDKYFPPNGYNCRCRVEALSEEEMKKKGLKVSDGRSMGYEVMPFVKTGWDYNPGKEYYKPKPEEYSEELKPIAEKINKEADKMADSIKGNDIKVNEPVMDITKVEKPADYEEAKSIEAAEEYAIKTLGVKRASFKGLSLDVVNEFNNAIKKDIEQFPAIREFLKFVGEDKEHTKLLEKLAYEEKYNSLSKHLDEKYKIFRAKNKSKEEILKYFQKGSGRNTLLSTYSREVKNSSGVVINYSRELFGITINSKKVSSLADIDSLMKKMHEAKFFSTGSFEGAIHHEIGHILDKLLGLSENKELKKLRNLFYLIDKSSLTEELSKYSWNNNNPEKIREFIAEAWAEYRTSPNPRELARKVGSIIESEYNKKYGKNK